jgi:hypothetical protein
MLSKCHRAFRRDPGDGETAAPCLTAAQILPRQSGLRWEPTMVETILRKSDSLPAINGTNGFFC